MTILIPSAHADEPALQLGIGGYVEAYGVYTDQDEAAGTSLRKGDFRKYSEVHMYGETTLDNGVTAGARIEMSADRADGASTIQESYFYLANRLGRVNVGEEDGAAFLLQVAAPGADDLVDGVRPHIGTFAAGTGGTLNYAHDDYGYANKITYLTPVYDGLQAGLSYIPSANGIDVAGTASAQNDDDFASALKEALEIAVRYEQTFGGVDLALGTGYSRAEQEDIASALEDELITWNAGGVLGWNGARFGVAYLSTNNAVNDNLASDDTDTLVIGADYTIGTYTIGGSYLNQTNDNPANDQEIDRYTLGGLYAFAPGMTLRAAAQHQQAENIGGVAAADADGTQVTLGSQLNF